MARTLEKARETLVKGGDLVALAEAIGTIVSDPASSLDDIRLGLPHGGMIAEQAAIALRLREAACGPSMPSNAAILSVPQTQSHLGR